MLSGAARWFAALPTAVKLLLILSAALLPIGVGLVWVAGQGIGDANALLRSRTEEQSRLAVRGIESLVARNALALRIAANGHVADKDSCQLAQRSLSITPAVAQRFELEWPDGKPVCEVGDVPDTGSLPPVAPGDIALGISPGDDALIFRVGVSDGMATGSLADDELRSAVSENGASVRGLAITDGKRRLIIVSPDPTGEADASVSTSQWPIGSGRLKVLVSSHVPMITTGDRLMLLLPFLMWLIAALITWILVTRLLIRPLRQLQRAVVRFEPGEPGFVLPDKLGPATEIQELRDSFQRAVTLVGESERDMGAALDGQRRLVREVHHRVKNNLQVVASLINIHGRSAETPAARAAYG
jgi:two-component system, sensor histidine kinase PdtaS